MDNPTPQWKRALGLRKRKPIQKKTPQITLPAGVIPEIAPPMLLDVVPEEDDATEEVEKK